MMASVAVPIACSRDHCPAPADRSIFDFSAETINGETISLSSFRGKKAFLIVNVACQ